MTLNGTTPHAPLFGAGHIDIDESPCQRCGKPVWHVRGERTHPLYENEDGTAHALTCGARVRSAVLIVKPKKAP